MAMQSAPSPTSLEALRLRLAEGVAPGRGDEDSARRQWWAALATIQEEFLLPLQPLSLSFGGEGDIRTLKAAEWVFAKEVASCRL